jgi:hypothetical protein
MRKIQAAFYTFEEMEHLLERCCFTSGEDFDIEVIDHYYWQINYYPDDAPDDSCFTLSDFDTLPVLSKVVGFRLVNTHVSRDGIWLEGEEMLPKRKKR